MEENRFRKDVADPNVDMMNLNRIFEVDDITGDIVDTTTGEIIDPNCDISTSLQEVNELKKELKTIEESMPDIDKIILSNIDRANSFLDKVETQILNGNISASLLESCASLINAVTSAATSITGISYNNDVLEIRREELRIREKKLTIESIVKPGPGGDVNITNNNLTMTREELLKELRDSQQR